MEFVHVVDRRKRDHALRARPAISPNPLFDWRNTPQKIDCCPQLIGALEVSKVEAVLIPPVQHVADKPGCSPELLWQ